MLKLYSKDKCFYCRNLKKKLDEWGFEYTMIDVEHDSVAMSFMESKGHRTVPQLYYNEVDIQRGNSTELTKTIISDRIERVQWPTIDSGIE